MLYDDRKVRWRYGGNIALTVQYHRFWKNNTRAVLC